MFLTILDLILILILFIFIAFGFALGLIYTIGALVGFIGGAWIAGVYYLPFANWLEPFVLGSGNVAKIIAFIVIFTVANRLIGFIFWIINKIFKLFTLIPFLKTINRFAGAVLGLIEGVLSLGLVLVVVAQFPFSSWLANHIADSSVANFLMSIIQFISPILPQLF
ncbi:MAG: hypothetical protein COT81_04710 [Candidatus Buchananbacteria bacterium CG10_big_fil_rev_8_21_14_0_10_42_9]|uniref:Colicin V production protein n=1 Tax=Candidatus Buchananbacteria bacterium CG10_big_fil_rev_8_21_14_0_10_42_9 TaxID=1974526 RepID=A0A2H0W092_9BACT|nr:MAG: hypothetical protein COT81_04710 [Candidatus Buchananbacteria bacterium CG10_big_fil_rev_8_21_14_0_10_42_9]